MTYAELAQAVMRHAEAHYADGGWDVIVECWTLDEIASSLEQNLDGELTPEAAVDSFRTVVSIWADREADARNSAF